MLGDLALVEDDVFLGVDAAGEEGGGDLPRRLRQLGRVLPHRDGVHVDDAIDAIVLVLQRDELHDGAEIVAQVKIAGRLHAGEDPVLEGHSHNLANDRGAKWHDLGRHASLISRARPIAACLMSPPGQPGRGHAGASRRGSAMLRGRWRAR